MFNRLLQKAQPQYLSELHTARRVVAEQRGSRATYFILTRPFEVRVFGGKYRAPCGYSTNFASVPWFARWLVSVIGRWTEASVIHDAGCDKALEKETAGASPNTPSTWQLANLPRSKVDRILFALMLRARVRRWRATLIYAAVSLRTLWLHMRPTINE